MALALKALRAHVDKFPHIKIAKETDRNGFADSRIFPFAREVVLYAGIQITGLDGLWHADYLNQMLSKLIPAGLAVEKQTEFRDGHTNPFGAIGFGGWRRQSDILRLGYCMFVEDVGISRVNTEIEITDPDLMKTRGYKDGILTEPQSETTLKGSITLLLYPNVATAIEAHDRKERGDTEWQYGIPASEFERLKAA